MKPVELVPCVDDTWSAFEQLVTLLTRTPVRYGPGRGLWLDGKFVVTYNPGSLTKKVSWASWPNVLGKPYPSFHCSSFTNFFLGWLLRRNELYTHAGNIPDLLAELCVKGPELHQRPGAGPWRGYGDAVSLIPPDGSGFARSKCGDRRVLDAREIYARRHTLPTFLVWGQSTRGNGKWKWWHHTGLFVVDHRDGSRLYRIAADGYVGSKGYTADPMRWIEVTEKNIASLDACVYRVFGIDTLDGTYGDQGKPIAEVVLE